MKLLGRLACLNAVLGLFRYPPFRANCLRHRPECVQFCYPGRGGRKAETVPSATVARLATVTLMPQDRSTATANTYIGTESCPPPGRRATTEAGRLGRHSLFHRRSPVKQPELAEEAQFRLRQCGCGGTGERDLLPGHEIRAIQARFKRRQSSTAGWYSRCARSGANSGPRRRNRLTRAGMCPPLWPSA